MNRLLPLLYALLSVTACITLTQSMGLPAPSQAEGNAPPPAQQELGLYNATDKVTVLTDVNFKNVVVQQNHSALVEFYNSYCGHCKRFAPYYKELAAQLHSWRDVLWVCAIDCAVEENNGICREYEIMGYPTLRYFGPGYDPSAKNYGQQIDNQDLDVIRETLAQWLVEENGTAATSWPDFHTLATSDMDALFTGVNEHVKLQVLIYEPDNSTLSYETILHFNQWRNVRIRRITDATVAQAFKIDGISYKMATVDRSGHIVPYGVVENSAIIYSQLITGILNAQHLTERTAIVAYSTPATVGVRATYAANQTIISEVLRHKHLVYQADLEMAIRMICFNEVPKSAHITGESLLALQRFLAVLQNYNPLSIDGQSFVSKLHEFVVQHNQSMSGMDFQLELARLEHVLPPAFASGGYVGCVGSKSSLRGYTCSLWTLFHYLTVRASQSEKSNDPLEVLQAIHGYVKHFFGCTDCAEHFQEMAARRHIWNTPSKEEAVLWLWIAHNEVNKRLAGDATEDPKFPKQQFPTNASCVQCYRSGAHIVKPEPEIDWNTKEVLNFLVAIYDPSNISHYGMTQERVAVAEHLRQKRLTNVFSDMDMRMGMLLYGFCIVMMVVAFKLFVFRGYRKKPYSHDLLGKV